MTILDPVKELEETFLPRLQAARDSFASEYPSLTFNVWSSPTGSLTEYKGHDVGIECMFPDAPDDRANCVAIIVGVKHLTTLPLLCDASVGWGAGASPDITLNLLPSPVAYSQQSLSLLSLQFEQLLEVFGRAVAAGPIRVGA
jgi:hypothetical protein